MSGKLASILFALALIGGVALSAFVETRVGDFKPADGLDLCPAFYLAGDK